MYSFVLPPKKSPVSKSSDKRSEYLFSASDVSWIAAVANGGFSPFVLECHTRLALFGTARRLSDLRACSLSSPQWIPFHFSEGRTEQMEKQSGQKAKFALTCGTTYSIPNCQASW